MNRFIVQLVGTAAVAVALLAAPALAIEVQKTYDFALDEWLPVEAEEGSISLHQIRIQQLEGRVTKSALQRPLNQAYLQAVQIQLEYSNSGSKQVSARIEVEWLDEDGVVIDGFTANEDLEKKSAHKMTRTSLSTIAYGLERATSLQVRISYEPRS